MEQLSHRIPDHEHVEVFAFESFPSKTFNWRGCKLAQRTQHRALGRRVTGDI